jgi:hypothetical protein
MEGGVGFRRCCGRGGRRGGGGGYVWKVGKEGKERPGTPVRVLGGVREEGEVVGRRVEVR